MKSCARCSTVAPETAFKCPSCGALLVAPPPVPATVGAPASSAAAPAAAPATDEQFFAPAAFQPITRTVAPAPPSQTRKPPLSAIVLVVIVAVVGATAAYATIRSSGSSKPKTPIALPPHDSSAGLPGGLGDAVRIQAESSRQIAFSAIAQARSENLQVTPAYLEGVDPSLKWFAADYSSTGPKEVSLAAGTDTFTIAISASSKEVCAFGRLTPGQPGQYVTMANVSSCRAADAPAAGWSTLKGGSASDLPPDGY